MKTLAGALVVVVLAALAVMVAVYSGGEDRADAGGNRAGSGDGAGAPVATGPGGGSATAPAASGTAENGTAKHDAAGGGASESSGGGAGDNAPGRVGKDPAGGEAAESEAGRGGPDGGSEPAVPTPEELAELEKERAEVAGKIEALVKNSAPGSEHDRMSLLSIRVYHGRHAGLAIDALERLLPEHVDAASEWPGVSQEVVQALVVLAAKADQATLEARVFRPLIGRWQKDTWVSNGNRARFDARVKDAHESVPPCWAMGPRGAALALVLAAASDGWGVLLPKARLLIRELADDTSIDGAERRAAAEPWISQVMESYLTLGESAPAEQILWDLDPLNMAEFRIREYGSADGFPDWWDPEEDGEPFSERVARDWAEYARAEDGRTGAPREVDPLRLRPWSKRLRHHAGILSRVVAHKKEWNDGLNFGSSGKPRTEPVPAHLFSNPMTIDEDALSLASELSKDLTWPVALERAIEDLERTHSRSKYSVEQYQMACQAAFGRLIADEPGSWPAEARIAVIDCLRDRVAWVVESPRSKADFITGEYGISFKVESPQQMTAVIERLGKYPASEGMPDWRRMKACELIACADAQVAVLLEGCSSLMQLLQPGIPSDIGLMVPERILSRLSHRFAYERPHRRAQEWATLAHQYASLIGERARNYDSIVAGKYSGGFGLYPHRRQLEILAEFATGAGPAICRRAGPDVRDALRLHSRLGSAAGTDTSVSRTNLEDVQLSRLRLRLVFEGWDV